MTDITIMIQGPLNERSLTKIPEYETLGRVVLSTWSDEDVEHVAELVTAVSLRTRPKKEYYVGTANQTFSYQVHSIYGGLQVADTQYVIRTRSDECYNLEPMIEKYRRDCVAFTVLCGNIFFKPWGSYGFHMGDHLFMGYTDILRDAYRRLVYNVDRYNNKHCAEQSSSMAILDAVGRPWTREAFEETFDVIDINELKPFIARWNTVGRDYVNDFSGEGVITKRSEI